MNLQRRGEIKVIAECPNDRHWAQEMRRAVAELLAHIDALEQTAAERVIADGGRGPTPDYTGEGSAWVPPEGARGVVVPDDDRPSREFLENYVEGFDPGERSAALFGWREGRRHLREHSRAIPAGRVPGEGMVALRRFAERCAQRDHQPDEHIGCAKCVACEAEDALRANQGGAAT